MPNGLANKLGVLVRYPYPAELRVTMGMLTDASLTNERPVREAVYINGGAIETVRQRADELVSI